MRGLRWKKMKVKFLKIYNKDSSCTQEDKIISERLLIVFNV